MTPAEINLIEVAKRYTLVSAQLAQAYSAEQAKLGLALVLAPSRLSSPAGAQESLAAIERLARLTDKYKAALEKVFLAIATDLTKALAAIPEAQQAEYRTGILKSIHGHLAAQSQLYENRGSWITAAREICGLVETRRDTASFDGEYIVFREDEDHDLFGELMENIEDAHRAEVEHMQQMHKHFSEAAAALSLHAR